MLHPRLLTQLKALGLDDHAPPADSAVWQNMLHQISSAYQRLPLDEGSSWLHFPTENPNPVFQITPEGEILYANAAGHQLLEEAGLHIGSKFIEEWQPLLDQISQQQKVTIEHTIAKRAFLLTIVPVKASRSAVIYATEITGHKQVEHSLEESKQRYRQIIETASDVVYVVNVEGYFTYVSPSSYGLTGYAPEELYDVHFTQIIDPEWRQTVVEFYTQQLREEIEETRFEFPILTASGECRWVEQQVKLIRREGQVSAMQSIVRDVTERKAAAGLALNLNARLSVLIENLQAGVLVEDQERRIALINQDFCTMFGIPAAPKQLLGTDCSQSAEQTKHLFVDPEGFVERISEILAAKQIVTGEYLTMADGRILERDYIPIVIEGVYQGHLWKYHDASERKHYETDLRRSEAHALQNQQRVEAILNSSSDTIILIYSDGKISQANPAFNRLFGYQIDEVFQQHINVLIAEDSRPTLATALTAIRESHQPQRVKVLARQRDGSLFNVDLALSPIMQSREGEMSDIICSIRDITESKQLEEALARSRDEALEASRLKSEFLATMSHEIRTPMNGIIGMAELLMDTPLDEDQQEFATVINEQAFALLAIINDILDFSKIEAGKLILESRDFDLPPIVENIAKAVAPKLNSKNLQLKIEVDAAIPRLNGDPTRLRQVLLNLISNAIKFTPQGWIAVRAQVKQNGTDSARLYFEVEDTGIGIGQAAQKRLFEPFTQVDGSVTREYGGTGLGLAICKRLVEAMGGEIGIRSIEGSGTVFWFTIQAATALPCPTDFQPGRPAQPVAQVATPPANDGLILVVEDNLVNLQLTLLQLEKLGYKAEGRENGLQALEAVLHSSKSYSLVLMDCQMPEMDGFTATRQIRAQSSEQTAHLPIIAMTANAMKGDRELCIATGMDDYISKPISMEMLKQVVSKWYPK